MTNEEPILYKVLFTLGNKRFALYQYNGKLYVMYEIVDDD